MFKQLVCLVVGTLAVGSQAFMAPSPLVKASSSAAARVYQPIQAETGTCVCIMSISLRKTGEWRWTRERRGCVVGWGRRRGGGFRVVIVR